VPASDLLAFSGRVSTSSTELVQRAALVRGRARPRCAVAPASARFADAFPRSRATASSAHG